MKTAMPGFTRLEGHLKAEPPVGIYRLCRRLRRMNCHGSAEVAVAVSRAQTLVGFGPLGCDPAPAHNPARFHLKYVCKVATERDLELEPHRLQAIVGEVEIFVHTASDRPAYREAQGARRDRAVFGEQRAVGEKHAGRIVAYRAAVQKFP